MIIKEYQEWLKDNVDNCLRVINVHPETISDGIGLRLSIYFSGCSHFCKGCHNSQSWAYENGQILSVKLLEEIIAKYKSNPLLSGITLSGGDPFFKEDALLFFVKLLKQHLKCNIWLYTGYVYEEVSKSNVLDYVDVLVDGRFEQDLYQPDLVFKGSSNQRIIDVNKTKKQDKINIIG